MSRRDEIGKTATKVTRKPDGSTVVRYHETEVVTVRPDGTIHLDTGGWFTRTTQLRMNQTASEFGIPFRVSGRCQTSRFDPGPWTVHRTGADPVPFDGRSATFEIVMPTAPEFDCRPNDMIPEDHHA